VTEREPKARAGNTARETLRLAPPVVLWWVWVAFVLANVLDFAAQGLPSARFGAVVGAILLFVTGLAYTLALRPRVVIAGDGLTVVNPYRTHFVPWRLITFVDTGEWVRIHYTPASDGEPADGTVASGAGTSGAGTSGAGTSGAGTSGAGTSGAGTSGAGAGRSFGAAPDPGASGASSAGGKTVHCWALYVSGRARRKIAAGPPRPREQRGLLGLGRGRGVYGLAAAADTAGAQASRLPEEARYLASLPPAKAMAVRLDSTADRERARAAGRATDNSKNQSSSATWSWPALAAVVIPALVLLALALA